MFKTPAADDEGKIQALNLIYDCLHDLAGIYVPAMKSYYQKQIKVGRLKDDIRKKIRGLTLESKKITHADFALAETNTFGGVPSELIEAGFKRQTSLQNGASATNTRNARRLSMFIAGTGQKKEGDASDPQETGFSNFMQAHSVIGPIIQKLSDMSDWARKTEAEVDDIVSGYISIAEHAILVDQNEEVARRTLAACLELCSIQESAGNKDEFMKLAKKIEMKTKSTQLFIEDYRISTLSPIAKQVQAINTGHMIAAGNLAIRNKVVDAIKKMAETPASRKSRKNSTMPGEPISPQFPTKRKSIWIDSSKPQEKSMFDHQQQKQMKKIALEARAPDNQLMGTNIQAILSTFEMSQVNLKKFEKAKILQQVLRGILISGRELLKIEQTAQLMVKVVHQDFGIMLDKLTKPDMVLNIILTFKSSRLAYYQQLIVLCTICIAKLLASIKRTASDRTPSLKNLHQGIADCVLLLKKIGSGSEISHRLQQLTLDLIELFDVTKLNAEDLENTVYLNEFSKKREGYFAKEDQKSDADEEEIKAYLEKDYADYLKSDEHARLEDYILNNLPKDAMSSWTVRPASSKPSTGRVPNDLITKVLADPDLKYESLLTNRSSKPAPPDGNIPEQPEQQEEHSKTSKPTPVNHIILESRIVVKHGKVVFRSAGHPEVTKLQNQKVHSKRSVMIGSVRVSERAFDTARTRETEYSSQKLQITDIGYGAAAHVWVDSTAANQTDGQVYISRQYTKSRSHRILSRYGTKRSGSGNQSSATEVNSKTARFLSRFADQQDHSKVMMDTVTNGKKTAPPVESELLKRVREKVVAFHQGDKIEKIPGFKLHRPKPKKMEFVDPWQESAAEISPHSYKPRRFHLGSSDDSHPPGQQLGQSASEQETLGVKQLIEKSGSDPYFTDKIAPSSEDIENSSDVLRQAEARYYDVPAKPTVLVLGTEESDPLSQHQVSGRRGLELKLHLVDAASSRKSNSRRGSVKQKEDSSDDGFGEIDFKPIKTTGGLELSRPKISNALSIEIPSVQGAIQGSSGSSRGLAPNPINNLSSPGKSMRQLNVVSGDNLSKVTHLVSPKHPDRLSSAFASKSPQPAKRIGSGTENNLLKSPSIYGKAQMQSSRRNSGVGSPSLLNPAQSSRQTQTKPGSTGMFRSAAPHSLAAGIALQPMHKSTVRVGIGEETVRHGRDRGQVRKSSRFNAKALEVESNEELVMKYSGLMRKLAIVELESKFRTLRDAFEYLKCSVIEGHENVASPGPFSGYTPSPIHHRGQVGKYGFTQIYGVASSLGSYSQQAVGSAQKSAKHSQNSPDREKAKPRGYENSRGSPNPK